MLLKKSNRLLTLRDGDQVYQVPVAWVSYYTHLEDGTYRFWWEDGRSDVFSAEVAAPLLKELEDNEPEEAE